MEESLRIKTSQWRRGGVLEEQSPLMEDMNDYFRKWKGWRNTNLGSHSSTSKKSAEKDEARDN